MISEKRLSLLRLISVGVLFFGVSLFYIIRLVSLQIAGQDYYTMSTGTRLTTRTVAIAAQRGEIFDRNGTALVTNRYAYSVRLDAGSMYTGNAQENELLLFLTDRGADCFTPPDSPFLWAVSGDDLLFSYDEDYLATTYGKRYTKLLSEITDGKEVSPTVAAFRLMARYGICQDDLETLNYPAETAVFLLNLRLDLETHRFSASEPYTILENVDMALLSELREDGWRGISIVTTASRVYEYPGVASHILGRVGKIQGDVTAYTEQGYAMDAIVGISGAEYAFESYLRGIDGELVITEDAYGNVVDQYVKKEPVAGSDVYLTIDLLYQTVAEQALKENIEYIVNQAIQGGEALTGEDANAGAVTMLDAKTGEVLALASYPTFDLSTFSQDFAELNTDPALPMLNRALSGQYPPGSTFKVGIASAALMENVLTPETLLECTGTYEYYKDSGFEPECWIHAPQYHYGKHGLLNVSSAIKVSCNCFFYEVGRQLGISTMNRYCSVYGFGQHTGIELGESVGVLAGPDYRESTDGESWSPGDTCTAAIGQSDNLVTPLQMSVYISTIINNGDRLKATLLREVRTYAGEVLYTTAPVVEDSIAISASVRSLVLNAMKGVIEDGSARRIFQNYPVAVGGKTGTAQRLSTESAFATFMAFAPFDDPEVVVSCIIERGAAGTDAGFAVRDVFDAYFGLGDYAPAADNGGTTN